MVKKTDKQKVRPLEVPGDGSGSSLNLPEDKLGERIKARREELRLNYEELSRLTALYDAPEYKKGLTAAMLARYEKGADGKAVYPGARELRLLCDALNVPADWLLLGIDKEHAAQSATRIVNMLARIQRDLELYPMIGQPIWVTKEAEHVEKLHRVRKPKAGGESTE